MKRSCLLFLLLTATTVVLAQLLENGGRFEIEVMLPLRYYSSHFSFMDIALGEYLWTLTYQVVGFSNEVQQVGTVSVLR